MSTIEFIDAETKEPVQVVVANIAAWRRASSKENGRFGLCDRAIAVSTSGGVVWVKGTYEAVTRKITAALKRSER